MKEFAKSFYKSKAWQRTRQSYAASVGYLCEECLRKGLCTPGRIVHHKIFLTPENINNPAITLSFDNLEMLCRECHAEKHPFEDRTADRSVVKKKRFWVDAKTGKIVKYDNNYPPLLTDRGGVK